MATKHTRPTLSGLVDTDSEEENQYVNTMPTPDSAKENKKGRGRPKVNAQKATKPSKVTKAKAPARRTSGRLNAKDASAATKGKRKALADKTNQQSVSDTEEVDEFDGQAGNAMSGDELDETMLAAPPNKGKGSKTTIKSGKAATVKSKASKSTAKATEVHDHRPHATKKAAEKKAKVVEEPPEKVIMETQMPATDMEIDDYANEEVENFVPRSTRKMEPRRANSRIRQGSVQPRRPGSASDTERNDTSVRRKLGEMTTKFENLELRYQDLKEVGVEEAKRNFDRLQKQTEQKTIVANNLIASLKADVAALSAQAKQAQTLQKKLDSQASEMAKLQPQISELSTLLKDAKSENKSLSTKLAANRNVAASIESANTRVPESAKKSNGSLRMVGTVEAAQVAQAAQLKEDLYSDLTGLITRGVKREAEEDVFDCIQTGRNGTLHFKLAVANEKSADSYDNAQCVYTPQLDPSRDKALMCLLPDYLTDEITFPRPQAAKFYARVMKALTEKVVE